MATSDAPLYFCHLSASDVLSNYLIIDAFRVLFNTQLHSPIGTCCVFRHARLPVLM